MWHLLKKKKNYFRQIYPFRGTILTFLSLFIQCNIVLVLTGILTVQDDESYQSKEWWGLILNENNLQHRRKKCVCGLYRGFREWRSSDGRSLRRINSTPLSPFYVFVTNENGQKENVERKCGIGNGDFQVGFNLSLSGGGEIGGVQIRIQPTRPTGRCRCPNYLEWGWGGRWWWQW